MRNATGHSFSLNNAIWKVDIVQPKACIPSGAIIFSEKVAILVKMWFTIRILNPRIEDPRSWKPSFKYLFRILGSLILRIKDPQSSESRILNPQDLGFLILGFQDIESWKRWKLKVKLLWLLSWVLTTNLDGWASWCESIIYSLFSYASSSTV